MSDSPRVDPGTMLGEAASLFFLIGGMGAKHLILVGGLVPPLLVRTPLEQHVGSADVDLCLSVAIAGGATIEYYKSIEAKLTEYFAPVPNTAFRWKKKPGSPGVDLLVDFLAPESAEDALMAEGTRSLGTDPAATNAGPRLRPLALKAGALMDLDGEDTELKVDYVYGTGKAVVRLRHTGPVGLLAAKAEALNGRAEAKDGYDVAWYCINAAPTAAEVAEIIAGRRAFSHALFPESLSLLRRAFAEPDLQAPIGYAALARPDSPAGSLARKQAQNDAHLVVTEVVDRLVVAFPWDTMTEA